MLGLVQGYEGRDIPTPWRHYMVTLPGKPGDFLGKRKRTTLHWAVPGVELPTHQSLARVRRGHSTNRIPKCRADYFVMRELLEITSIVVHVGKHLSVTARNHPIGPNGRNAHCRAQESNAIHFQYPPPWHFRWCVFQSAVESHSVLYGLHSRDVIITFQPGV